MAHRTPLKKARVARGQTLAEVATIVGTDVGNLSRIERGIQVPSPSLASKLATHFKKDGLTEIHILYPERFRVAA